MILVNKPQKKDLDSGSPLFLEAKGICMALGMSKPPANIAMFQFFSGIEKKVSKTWVYTLLLLSMWSCLIFLPVNLLFERASRY